MPARPTALTTQPATQRALAAELFNHVWTLLDKEDRSEREDDMMVAAAYASRFLWEQVGTPVNHARGEWQISRACVTAGRAEEALLHAERCLQICEQHALEPFDLAYAHEALARAAELRGDSSSAAAHADHARSSAAMVTDPDEHELLQSDLATLPA
jgi:hypothetical protein